MEDFEHSIVKIDANGIDIGEYSLILESFDASSKLKMALKTDLVKIRIYNELFRA